MATRKHSGGKKGSSSGSITKAYALAKERYAGAGVDTEDALKRLAGIPVSMHCWQGDDVGGFERTGSLDGGLVATGNYPGKARTPDELRRDMEKAFSLIPGRHRINLHAIYGEFGGKRVERSDVAYSHFSNWVSWAKSNKIGIDFNPSFFSHPKAASGLTLSHPDAGIRRYWIEHGKACRRIGARIGQELGNTCVTNVWIPDGSKDVPADRIGPRERLKQSLDDIFAEEINPAFNLDAVESKLFGIGSESYVAGSHEFYLAYAVQNRKLLTLDTGHFHPTESIVDKIPALLMFVDGLLLHVSRGIRWDSDHVVTCTDDLRDIAREVVRSGQMKNIHIGLDYFDASINRVAAWVIGMRAMGKALLEALLEPAAGLRKLEADGDLTGRLALMEEAKSLPIAAVWDFYCESRGVPVGAEWIGQMREYERKVQSLRK